MRFALWSTLVLCGCEPSGEDVGTTVGLEAPDVRGTYEATVSEPEGCDATQAEMLAVFDGQLTITGPADALVFDWDGGLAMQGVAEASFTFEATGTAEVAPDTLDVYAQGLVFIGDETWNLDGDLTVDRFGSTDSTATCTLTALLEAVQIP